MELKLTLSNVLMHIPGLNWEQFSGAHCSKKKKKFVFV